MSRIDSPSVSPSTVHADPEPPKTEATASQPKVMADREPPKPGGDVYESSGASATSADVRRPQGVTLPPAPRPPLEMKLDGLEGEALEDARAMLDAQWKTYEQSYKSYLTACEGRFAQTKSLETLKTLSPE